MSTASAHQTLARPWGLRLWASTSHRSNSAHSVASCSRPWSSLLSALLAPRCCPPRERIVASACLYSDVTSSLDSMRLLPSSTMGAQVTGAWYTSSVAQGLVYPLSRGRRQLNLPARMLTGKHRQVGKDRQTGRATKRQVPRECWRYPAAESRGQGWKLVAARPAPCHPETPSPAASCSPAPTALMPASARPTSFRACAWLLCQNACILQRGRQARLLSR